MDLLKNLNNMITAEELSKSYTRLRSAVALKDLSDFAIEFAKLHVKAALKQASERSINENMIDNCDDHTPYWGNCQTCGRSDNFKRLTTNEDNIQNSILNAYPLENIK